MQSLLLVLFSGILIASPSSAGTSRFDSRLTRDNWKYIETTAKSLSPGPIRETVFDLLASPTPSFIPSERPDEWRRQACDRLIQAKSLVEGADPMAIFPQPDLGRALTSAPGGHYGTHHGYPGGWVEHTALNLRMSLSYLENYLRTTGLDRSTLRRDYIVAAPILHDILKGYTFQWAKDGSCNTEPEIAGTSSHHVLVIAEAIHRRLPNDFVFVLASAHDAPNEKGRPQVIRQIEAAYLLLGRDPAKEAMFTDRGGVRVLSFIPPMEAFIHHLSDQDWVLASEALRTLVPVLREIYETETRPREGKCTFNEFRNSIFSDQSAIGLYALFARRGQSALKEVALRLPCATSAH